MEDKPMSDKPPKSFGQQISVQFFLLAMSAVVALGGVSFGLLIDRMNKQEAVAASDIAALREEIKATKSDAREAVIAAVLASKDSVAATATALKDSNAASALAANAAMVASAAALRDQVSSSANSASERTSSSASALNDKILVLSTRLDKLEERAYQKIENKQQ